MPRKRPARSDDRDDDSYIGASSQRPLRDDEFPDEVDPDAGDDFGDDTLPCPHCKHDILENSPWCPHCGNYLHQDEAEATRAPWITITLILVVLMLVIATVLTR
jgi:hypothetical protein